MKRMKFLTAALGVAIVAAIALTGCDEVLNEPKKGTETEVTGYGIISLDQSAVTCTVIFDPQGGDMGNVPKGPEGQVKIFVPYGEKAPKPSPDPTKASCTFGGWYTDTAFTSLYDFNAPVKVGFTVYAKWVPNPCKVDYSLNGAPGTPPYPPGYVTYGQTLTEPAAPQWTGHIFIGWFRTPDGTGTAWNFKTDTVTATMTLYANWILGAVGIGKNTFAEVIADMAENWDEDFREYTLTGDVEVDYYTGNPTLTAEETSPASVTIYGNGRVVTVPTGGSSSITVGSGVTLTLNNITFKTIPFSVAAGGTLVLEMDAVVTGNARSAVLVEGGTLEMRDGSSVTNNLDSGVKLGTNGSLTMDGGEISDNSAWTGGGVWMGDNSVFTMNDGVITNNTSENMGGGIMMNGGGSVFNMTGGEISENNAMSSSYGNGGGIYTMIALNATFNMSGGVIKNNQAPVDGGGVCIHSGNTAIMRGGEITGNTAENGGGMWLNGTLIGDPQIGGTDPGPKKGWIHGNTLNDFIN
jgi:uncharacterized repeat protein (TIGR02543 family)